MISQLKLLTYNIHGGIGTDGRYELARIAQVLVEEQPDLVALQEVDCGVPRSAYDDQSHILARAMDMHVYYCQTRAFAGGKFGLAVLSRFPLVHNREYDISYSRRREPRYCLRVDVAVTAHRMLHVFNCHLGLEARERRYQRRQMLSEAILLSEDLQHPVILMGDFNDRPLSVVHRALRGRFRDAYLAAGKRWGPTFWLGPIPFKLDHIYVSPTIHVRDCRVRADAVARVASDHRPLVCTIEIDWERHRSLRPAVSAIEPG